MQLPKMTVEKRVSTTAHAIPAPDLSPENMELQIKETIILNDDAKENGWKQSTLDILKKYIPIEVTDKEIKDAVLAVSGYRSRKKVSKFVVDDMCLEYFNKALKYCLKMKQKHVKDEGFIDGSWIGYVNSYVDRLKVTLEQCFDAKYFYKLKRPLEHCMEKGIDLSWSANAIHPGHWSYPAGHGTKFVTVLEVLNEVFVLDEEVYKNILIDSCVEAMWRSGNLIHYPMDNLVWGHLTKLKEFQK